MVFGLSNNQRLIMAYLYQLEDKHEVPPDEAHSLMSIAKGVNIVKNDVKEETEGLIKKGYLHFIIHERQRYYYLLPPGRHEVEQYERKTSKFEISSKRIGYERGKEEG